LLESDCRSRAVESIFCGGHLPPDRGGRIPAVALTAYTRAEDRTTTLAAGFDTHIPKPVQPADVVAAVANLSARISKG